MLSTRPLPSSVVRSRLSALRLPAVLGLLGLAAATVAHAQTHSLERTDFSRGANLPPTSTALVDEATALQVNPGALSSVGSLQLFYAHERSLGRDQVVDSLYLGDTWGPLGLGASVEWVRFTLGGPTTPATASYRKTGFGLSLGGRTFALGATGNFFQSSDNAPLNVLTSIDVGVVARPTRYLSLGAVVKNVDQKVRGPITFFRRYEFGAAVRPFGERYALAADWILPDEFEVRRSSLGYTLRAEVLPGVALGAGLAHEVKGPANVRFQLGLTLDAPRVGLTYAGGGGDAGADHVALVRLSSERYPSMWGRGRVAMFDLADLLRSSQSTTATLLGLSQPDPFLRTHELLEESARDPGLSGVVLKIDPLPEVGWGRVEELRQAVLRLRASGKRVVAVLLNGGDPEYFLSTAADTVYAAPQGALLVNGLAARVTFFGNTMEKLDVKWDVARVGAYKNFPDQFTRSDLSPEQRETIDAYLDTQSRHYVSNVAQARKLDEARVQAAFAEGLIAPRRAKELGLIDDVLDPQRLDDKLRELMPGARFDPAYFPGDERRVLWGRRPRIAVLPIIGSIAGGKSRQDPLGLAEIAGAETVVRALDSAAADPSVAAIVLRIDSPGGDGLASDLMYRAVLEAKKKKPVVASMGDVAASGGYYAAMGADEIFALPTTITGSIGVFFMKPALGGLGSRLGVTRELIARGPLADIDGAWNTWTEAERTAAQRWVDGFYDDFIGEVATSRKLEKSRVDTLARGRVWSGAAAKERGLVDTLGGLHDAVRSAQKRAGLDGKDVDLSVYGEPAGLFAAMGGEEGVRRVGDAVLPPASAGSVLSEAARQLLLEAGVPSVEALRPGLKAELPYRLVVE